MGQFPQQPYSQPPQYGSPQVPPGYGAPMPPQRTTSGTAIASLICGIVGCVPFVTSAVAIVLGIVGIRATRDPRYGGRGMAIAGLVLGIVGVFGWSCFGGSMIALFQTSKPAAAVAQQFTKDLAAGDVSKAARVCAAEVSPQQLQQAADQIQPWGALQDLTLASRNVDSSNGVTTWRLAGRVTFTDGVRRGATFELRKQPDGSYKIISFNLNVQPR